MTSSRLATLLSLLVIFLLAGLIPASQWRGDEYFEIPRIHAGGVGYMLSRVLSWSPRPLSEVFVYLYAEIVFAQNKPLIGGVLLLFWTILIAAVTIPAITTGKNLGMALVLLSMFLLGHSIGEVFYWPFGAVAYLPTLGAVALLWMLDVASLVGTPAGQIYTTIALLVAATCTEVGAVFVALYCVLAGLASLRDKQHALTWWLLPLLASLAVLYIMFIGRVANGHEIFDNSAAVHHPWASILAATPRFVWELLGRSDTHKSVYSGFLTKISFFLGVYCSTSCSGLKTSSHSQLLRIAMAIALIGSSFLMLSASYYQFGNGCCERHETMRECYIFVAVGSLACFVAGWYPFKSRGLAGWCFMLAIVIPLWSTASKIAMDYIDYGQLQSATSQTWKSGRTPGHSMIVTQAMSGRIIGGASTLPAGIYELNTNNSSPYANWVLSFFGKQSGLFTEPLMRQRE